MEPPPIIGPAEVQRAMDEKHLNLLATFHYVMAAVGALFACFPLIHVGMGVMMMTHPETFMGDKGPPPPPFIGWIFVIMGSVFILFGWAAAVCTFVSGRFLRQRKKRMFSFVVAAVLCMFMPFGTVLGIFTIIVLSKDSILRLYENRT